MPRNALLVPEGTHIGDWRRLGPFHENTGPNNSWNTRTYDVWHDKIRNVIGVCTRTTKTRSTITDMAETSHVAQKAMAGLRRDWAVAAALLLLLSLLPVCS